ncbi:hypothetical protein M9H77_22320 [Catharanthus roseus]|uniref:Uncharacterized protein n=1 Tax=Catharanthus roseus TaxID=4058 RepID=A0ACC0APS5_CATRO|nr:hypothetical protein M9H77_22320 [Catharanthus roseus]
MEGLEKRIAIGVLPEGYLSEGTHCADVDLTNSGGHTIPVVARLRRDCPVVFGVDNEVTGDHGGSPGICHGPPEVQEGRIDIHVIGHDDHLIGEARPDLVNGWCAPPKGAQPHVAAGKGGDSMFNRFESFVTTTYVVVVVRRKKESRSRRWCCTDADFNCVG